MRRRVSRLGGIRHDVTCGIRRECQLCEISWVIGTLEHGPQIMEELTFRGSCVRLILLITASGTMSVQGAKRVSSVFLRVAKAHRQA
jgi:TATA-box binding protein (TBP) (component of TFIID and TFIIIB)